MHRDEMVSIECAVNEASWKLCEWSAAACSPQTFIMRAPTICPLPEENCCLLHVFSFSSGVSSVFDQGATVHMKCSRVLQALGLHLKTAMYVPLGIFSSSRYE